MCTVSLGLSSIQVTPVLLHMEVGMRKGVYMHQPANVLMTCSKTILAARPTSLHDAQHLLCLKVADEISAFSRFFLG